MKRQRNTGFTLIELLTVIGIIAILSAITAVALPRMIEKARLTSTEGVFRNISTALHEYYAEYSSYPPAYGFIDWNARQNQIKLGVAIDDKDYYHLRPYLSYINMHRLEDAHDPWAESYDANGDGVISRLEYSPVGTSEVGSSYVGFPEELYDGSNNVPDVQAQLAEGSRPLFYIPVNTRQFNHAQRHWLNNKDFHAQTWNRSDPNLQNVTFPPARYDAFVLISVGPRNDLGGVLPESPIDASGSGQVRPRERYHVEALRAYFLATRDMNNNQKFDYDFYERTREKEGAQKYTYKGSPITNELPAFLPDGTLDPNRKNLPGPIIKRYGS